MREDHKRELLHNKIGRTIYLQKLTLDDAQAMHSYISDAEVSRYIGWPLTKTEEESKTYVKKLIQRLQERTHIYSSIKTREGNKHIGTIMIFNFNDEAKHAEVGYVIHRDYWGKGITSEALAMAVDFSFNNLKLNKLHAWVVDANRASAKVLEKNGFKQEGRLKDFYAIEGKIYDGLVYGLLNR